MSIYITMEGRFTGLLSRFSCRSWIDKQFFLIVCLCIRVSHKGMIKNIMKLHNVLVSTRISSCYCRIIVIIIMIVVVIVISHLYP